MKKLLSALISAALIALPLAVISTPVAAKTATHAKASKAKHVKKAHKAKAKHVKKAHKAKAKTNTAKSSVQPMQ